MSDVDHAIVKKFCSSLSVRCLHRMHGRSIRITLDTRGPRRIVKVLDLFFWPLAGEDATREIADDRGVIFKAFAIPAHKSLYCRHPAWQSATRREPDRPSPDWFRTESRR